MSAIAIAAIVVGAIAVYVFVAGIVYAVLEGVTFTFDGDRSLVAWAWPFSGPLWILRFIATLGIAAPRLIGEAIVRRRRNKQIPRAEVRRG